VCVIIDNLTSIIPSLSSEKTREFYGRLKTIASDAMSKEKKVTFILVAHTIKTHSDVPSLKDLQGVANVQNFLNQAISLWPTNEGEDVKMVKILKNRDKEKGAPFLIKLVETPYIHFEYVGETTLEKSASSAVKQAIEDFESGRLAEAQEDGVKTKLSKKELLKEVRKLLKRGIAQKDIANRLGVSEMEVSRAKKKIERMDSGKLS
jgi:predicted XRE-type DNA-binding protein